MSLIKLKCFFSLLQVEETIAMVVIKFATYTTRCPFSTTLIHPRNKICLFNKEQFDAFKRIVNEELYKFFPQDLITLIIQKTRYETFLGRFGHANVSHWTVKYTTSGRKTQPPLRFGNDRLYVKGSGFKGCDQYDRGYNGWNATDSIEFDRILDMGKEKEMDGFIVSDNELEECEWEGLGLGDETDERDVEERPDEKCKMNWNCEDESDSDYESDEDSD